VSATSQSIYRAIDGSNDNYLIYNADTDGTFSSRNTNFTTSEPCDGKSLKGLYDECKAYNFVSSKPTSISGANTDTFINEWPYAIDCSSNSNEKVVFLLYALSSSADNKPYYQEVDNANNYYEFTANGDYNQYNGAQKTSTNFCVDKSLTQIAYAGRAYHFKNHASENLLNDNTKCTETDTNSQRNLFLWGKIEQSTKTIRGVCMANASSERGVFIIKGDPKSSLVTIKILFYDGWVTKYIYDDINYVVFAKLISNSMFSHFYTNPNQNHTKTFGTSYELVGRSNNNSEYIAKFTKN